MKRKKTKIRWLTALVVMAMFVAILPCRVYAEEDGSSGGTDPSAPKVNNTYTHTYHTNVKITANVTEIMHDGSNSLTSETQVQKESGFIEGSVSSETVQAMITSLKNEIRNQYNQAYSSKETVTSTKLKHDHFESANIVTDASGNTITDIEDLKKILAGDIVNLEEKYGQITKNLDVHEYQVYELEYNLTLYDEETEIPNVDIENVWFHYQPGDVPKASATKLDPFRDMYDIEYEYWECMEQTEQGLEPTAFWYSDESKNNALAEDKKITSFEEGKSYMYSISLKAKDGYKFASDCTMMVNGSSVNAKNVTVSGSKMFVVAINFIEPSKPVQLKKIDLIELNGATVSFKAGDKPVFTGKVPDGAPYIYQCEWWLCGDAGVNSAEFWDKSFTEHITEFEAGKKYEYGAYFKAAEGYCFTSDTKLKINGTEYTYHLREGDTELENPDEMHTLWMIIGLTMTPVETSAQYEVIEGANGSWTQNTDGTLKVRANGDFSKFTGVKVDGTPVDAKNYTAVSGSTIVTLKSEYLRTLSEGSHTLTFIYVDGECSTKFAVKAAAKQADVTPPETAVKTPDQSKPVDQTTLKSPKTGDAASPFVWMIVLLATGVMAGVLVCLSGRNEN